MDRTPNGIGEALRRSFNSGRQPHRLVLSSPSEAAAAAKAEERRSSYQKQYWKKYRKRKRRVSGTLSVAEHEAAQTRADARNRKVWQQIWEESCAYRAGTSLPSVQSEALQRDLLIELRKIGTNINQLARLGHIQAANDDTERLSALVDDKLGQEVLRQFTKLETAVSLFEDQARHLQDGDAEVEHVDDHQRLNLPAPKRRDS